MPMMGSGTMGSGTMGPGMMSSGMMGSGMMGQGGSAAGEDGIGMMGATMGARHVEGRIAFLKTELKITAAQERLWRAVADVMRAEAGAGTTMPGPAAAADTNSTLPQRLAAREKFLSGRLDNLRKYRAAVEPLYAALNDEQKRTANELMGIGGGMMGNAMMGRMGMR